MGRKKATNAAVLAEAPPLKFHQKLVLNQWMLWLFEKKSFDELADPLKLPEMEGLDEDNTHKFLHQFKLLWELAEFPGDTLQAYGQNIVSHTLILNERRAPKCGTSDNVDCFNTPYVFILSAFIRNRPYPLGHYLLTG